jgi:hypothetical protein
MFAVTWRSKPELLSIPIVGQRGCVGTWPLWLGASVLTFAAVTALEILSIRLEDVV